MTNVIMRYCVKQTDLFENLDLIAIKNNDETYFILKYAYNEEKNNALVDSLRFEGMKDLSDTMLILDVDYISKTQNKMNEIKDN